MNKKTIDKETEERALKKLSEKYKGTGDQKDEYERLMKILDDTLKSSGKKGYEKERYYYDQGEYEEPEKPEISKFQSFFSIWFRPRDTIRSIVDSRPFWSVLVLVMITPILNSMMMAYSLYLVLPFIYTLPEFANLPYLSTVISLSKTLVIVCIPLAPLISIIGLYIGGVLYAWIGRWLGGKGTSAEVRIVVAWSQIPIIALAFINFTWTLATTLAYGNISMEDIMSAAYTVDPSQICLDCGLRFIDFALELWACAIMIVGLSEINKFSKWRAFATMLIIGILLLLFVFIIVIIIVLLFRARVG